MIDCDFYREVTDDQRSSEGMRDRMPRVAINRFSWCAHPKHPPVSKWWAQTIGGGQLECDGKRRGCPLSDTQFDDV